jgi:hypothetical protein
VQREAEALTELVMHGLAPRSTEAGASGSELARLRAQVDRLEALFSSAAEPGGRRKRTRARRGRTRVR